MSKKWTMKELAALSDRELNDVFENGVTPDPDKLAGWEFDGYNVPFFTKIMGIRKFQKGFYREGDGLWGYNVAIHQNSIDEPWRCKPVNHNPQRFGFYKIDLAPEGRYNLAPGAIFLNYKEGNNRLWEGSFLRDYLKQVSADDDDLYLGKAYSEVAGRFMAPSFFILRRNRRAPTEVIR